MQTLNICLVVCLCGAVLATQPNTFRPRVSLDRNAKDQNSGLGIVGGSTASIKKFPYQAAILYDGILIGSGAIVGKKYILTSAYLINFNSALNLEVRVGSASSSEGGQLLTVDKVLTHEKYSNFNYDTSLLKLSKAIKYSKTVKPIKLASKVGKNATSVVVSGYGETQKPTMTIGDLTKGKQNVISQDLCQKSYLSKNITLDESNSCAYSPSVCACFTDMGDPLVQKNKLLGWYLGGTWCCYDSLPQIYSSVPAVNKWVKKKMKEEGYDIKEDFGHYYGEEK